MRFWDPSRNPSHGRTTVIRVGARRRDGKYPVHFGFYGRPIRKILAAEQIREWVGRDGYRVVGFREVAP